jgi:glutamate-ammonia-ligase adenylyltransferase
VVDAAAARRAHEALGDLPNWPVLAPVFSASPYLTRLARQDRARLDQVLADDPEARLEAILAEVAALERQALAGEAIGPALRHLKAELHLLTALADLGGVWDLDAVTGALTRFADAAVRAALAAAAAGEVAAGRLLPQALTDPRGPAPGLFVLALGKHGAFELNYSSDIDISIFYEPASFPLAEGAEAAVVAVRLTQAMAALLQDRTADGYVFRVDLRLRPDPSSSPAAVSVPAAIDYYESVGQNWERAAFIKARAVAGDMQEAQAFLGEMKAFIWRRNLDFAAIADIHSIKRQIHVHKVDDRLTAPGANLKLGHGGIREVEFYVQTQQLILGGRDPALRSPRTLDALAALVASGHVDPAAAAEMSAGYIALRALEHRAQMVNDEQTHVLPEAAADRKRVAALYGYGDLRRFDAAVEAILKRVNHRYGALFPEEESLSSRFGSLVFTGVDDDPETLKTLAVMGFSNPGQVAGTIRAWHRGRIAATRTERGRELFTRLAPRLLEAAHATGAPDAAFLRFDDFFSRLSSGVQIQSLFLAQPRLFELVVRVMAFAPRLASTLARSPAALDAMLDATFLVGLSDGDARAIEQAAASAAGEAGGFEAAMDAVRRIHREQAFRIGVQVMSGAAGAEAVGAAFADLADACIRALASASLAEVERIGGTFDGDVAVVALGKAGSREMTAGSDLDLMTLYRPAEPSAVSSVKGWAAETFHARFTQRLVAALTAPTTEGGLYQVDLRLRPSGTQGPLAVSLKAFEIYYADEAETWEFLALTRARAVWSSSPGFAAVAQGAIDHALRQPRDRALTRRDVKAMRALMDREKPAKDPWDMKLSRGGLVDIEFVAQYLQILHAAEGGPLRPHTAEALAAMARAGLVEAGRVAALEQAWRLQQDLSQVLKLALPEAGDPAEEPRAFRDLLARAGHCADFAALQATLTARRLAARAAYDAILGQ